LFLAHVREQITGGDNKTYDYIIDWISFIIQNRGLDGKKTKTAIILKGLPGCGKNAPFTDIISELLKGYANSNVTDINEISGDFNTATENKLLVVANELKNVGEGRLANFDCLKSIIKDPNLNINQKFTPRRESQNVSNFIFVSNHAFPVKIEQGDRRYVVCSCSGKYSADTPENRQYWAEFFKARDDPEFYNNLMRFFLDRDISGFNPVNIPETQAKTDIMDASISPVDLFIKDNYKKFVDGWLVQEVLNARSYTPQIKDLKPNNFSLQIKERCNRDRKMIKGITYYYYRLKPEMLEMLKPDKEEELKGEEEEEEECP
jgi:hypothetical protein